MINVKEAVKIAIDFVKNVYLGEGVTEKFDSLTLEEVELAEDSPYWFVTVGLGKAITTPFGGLAEAISGQTKFSVKYKILKIHRDTGEVVSMKIRPE